MAKKQTDKKKIKSVSVKYYEHDLPKENPGRDDMKQFYSWTYDDAFNAQFEWKKRHPNTQSQGPYYQWSGAMELKDLYQIYNDGNKGVILEALHICAKNCLMMPQWVEKAFLEAYQKVHRYEVRSWDDVFGRPIPKNVHLQAKQRERSVGWQVYKCIKELKRNNPSKPIDIALFEKVGERFGIKKTLVQKYYSKYKKLVVEVEKKLKKIK